MGFRARVCLALLSAVLPAAWCAAERLSILEDPFGHLPDGRAVSRFTLRNAAGMEARITNYGGIVTSLRVPDREGKFDDVVLGFDTLDAYLAGHPYFGCIVGRYANRIAAGRFELDGKSYRLATNNAPNHLHGGERGFDKHLWEASPLEEADRVGLRLRLTSADGDEGYPGTLRVTVTYWLDDENELRVEFEAETDAPTHVNLTQHSYFNLNGEGVGDVLDHELLLHASRFTPVDENLIPTGALAEVAGTPLDFRAPQSIGARIASDHVQMARGGGYDHNFVVDRDGPGWAPAATVHAPKTGRVMQVRTTQPGIQLYTGNFLDGTLQGKRGAPYLHRGGFCLETQHFPDSPNQPEFPSTVLRPGETYRHAAAYTFSVR